MFDCHYTMCYYLPVLLLFKKWCFIFKVDFKMISVKYLMVESKLTDQAKKVFYNT